MRTMLFEIGQQVRFRYHLKMEKIPGKIIGIDHYIHVGKNVSLYIIKDQYGIEHRVFESEIL